jgi:hypothetical protein
MCEKDWDCSLGMTGGFLEEFGGEGRITMEASASSQMQVTATPSPSEAEIPPAPDVACGMVRRARGEKGNKGGGECLPLPETVRCRPCFSSYRNGRTTIPQRTE